MVLIQVICGAHSRDFFLSSFIYISFPHVGLTSRDEESIILLDLVVGSGGDFLLRGEDLRRGRISNRRGCII